MFRTDDENLLLYEWVKMYLMDGRDFTWRGNLYDLLLEAHRKLLKRIAGRSRDRLPSQEEDDRGLEIVAPGDIK